MIYLDYSATTPVDERVLDSYIRTTKEFVGNANSMHTLGVKSKELLHDATNQIASILNIDPKEIIFTSGASESNATALKGVCFRNKKQGKHIISTRLEHKSILETLGYLSNNGYTVDFVELNNDGTINLNNLKELIREDTILVSICAVNSETGFNSNIKEISKIIKEKNPKTIFHSDMTQALGKMKFDLNDVDLASFSSHKIYAPKGIGMLYKKKNINLDILIYGTTENCPFRGGTPPLPLVVAFSKAMRLMYEDLDNKIKHCETLRTKLIEGLKNYPIRINSTMSCVPQIVNFSLLEIKSETFLHALEKHEVYVSTTTACSSGSESIALKALSNGDTKISTTSIRVSLSHLTTEKDIDEFLKIFKIVWDELLLKK